MILGGIAVVVVIVIVVMMNKGGGAKASEAPNQPAAAKPATAPAVAPVPLASAKVGKAPGRPAPPLTQETLGKLSELHAKAKVLYNEGSALRTAGDNSKARTKQGEAKNLLDQWLKLVEKPLAWQEEAQMGDWQQPAEYMTLEKLFQPYQTLTNQVRKGGGT